jgi:hypothetical protein
VKQRINHIDTTFANVRLRTRETKGFGSRAAGLAIAHKLLDAAQARCWCVSAPHLVALVRAGRPSSTDFSLPRQRAVRRVTVTPGRSPTFDNFSLSYEAPLASGGAEPRAQRVGQEPLRSGAKVLDELRCHDSALLWRQRRFQSTGRSSGVMRPASK